MSVKAFSVDSVGTVHVYKRKGTRSLRLSIGSDGKVKVTIPSWASFEEGLRFAASRQAWIQEHMPDPVQLLTSGQHIGKAHRLIFDPAAGEIIRTRIAGSEIHITRPIGKLITHPEVQTAARKASIRALRLEAEKLLPVRLRQLANDFAFTYTSVQVKQLKGRWGSCDAQRHIVLNLYLMQLPWKLIDYVLIHELVHTKHLDHGPGFWNEFLKHEPRAKYLRTQIRKHQPILAAVEATQSVA